MRVRIDVLADGFTSHVFEIGSEDYKFIIKLLIYGRFNFVITNLKS